jgi:hypothetical protein
VTTHFAPALQHRTQHCSNRGAARSSLYLHPPVNRHADDGVDAERVEAIDFLSRRDTAGGDPRRVASRMARMASMSCPASALLSTRV